MGECKPTATPMIPYLKKVTTSNLMVVDPMMCRWMISALMYLVNTRLAKFLH